MDGPRSDPVDRAAYAEFIRGIELRDVWLRFAHIDNEVGPEVPDKAHVLVRSQARWEPTPDGFLAFHAYRVRLQGDDGEDLATMEVVYGADYTSAQAMTDALFEAFADRNLGINTWPYFREFMSSATGRMGWLPITVPTFKPGAGTPPSKPSDDSPKPKTQRRRRETTR